MKYLPSHDVFFLHIPKCAGKSVHAALDAESASYAAFADDLGVTEETARSLALSEPLPEQAQGRFKAGLSLDGLGQVHPAHLPLFVLKERFPTVWAQLSGARNSFAMVREPRQRFLSALLQRMREFGDVNALRADDPAVRAEARRVCDWLEARRRFADLEFVHFIPQNDFVALDDERVLAAVFPVDRTDLLSTWLKTRTGLEVDISRSHTRRQPKRWARSLQPVARFAARRLMPLRVKKAIYPLWTGSAVFSDASESYAQTDFGAEIEGFIRDYYAADFALYEEAMAAAR